MKAKELDNFTFIGKGKYLSVAYNEHGIYSLYEERLFSRNRWNHSKIYKKGKINKKQTKWKAAA